jgi:hypothetical protein
MTLLVGATHALYFGKTRSTSFKNSLVERDGGDSIKVRAAPVNKR